MNLNYDLNTIIKIPGLNYPNDQSNMNMYHNYMIYEFDTKKFFDSYKSSKLSAINIVLNDVLNDAKNGDIYAKWMLGRYYFNKPFKKKKAFVYFLDAAINGDVDAQCAAGYCYLKGLGVSPNLENAIKFLSMSAEGLNMLGIAYFLGEGVPRDFNKAFINLMKADEMSEHKNNYIGRITVYHALIGGNSISIESLIDNDDKE